MGFGALALAAIGIVTLPAGPAGARGLLDETVQAYVPPPHAPHTLTAFHGYSRYDDYPSFGSSIWGTNAHPWQ
jgi:hypothetical protein